ncbi:MAG: hypothetical protein U1E10_06360 [Bdellovibrionales bacterium]|nr:hypothetical protein [Bdellovibrionales bacterium]
MNLHARKLKSDSSQTGSKLFGAYFFAAFFALSAFTFRTSAAEADRTFTSELYSQTMYRPDERADRPHGLFHETRLRASMGSELLESVNLDIGSYFLGEWNEAGKSSSAFTNTAMSPFLGARWKNSWLFDSTTATVTFQFEGRYREPISDFARATGVQGWDPRTGAAVGIWHQFDTEFFNRPSALFIDIYADLFYAPKYSSSPMSTAIARFGNRHILNLALEESWKAFADLYVELFQQNATSIELGTKRTEGRAGIAFGATRTSGSFQLRVYNGWPTAAENVSNRDQRPRTEALLVGGFSL